MRIFVYKTLIFFVATFFLYHFTIGYTIHDFRQTFYSSLDRKSIEKIKFKIRKELMSAVDKEKVLNTEDAILLNKLINKLKVEINEAN